MMSFRRPDGVKLTEFAQSNCELLTQYATDRVSSYKMRLTLYALGCTIGAYAMRPELAALALVVLLFGDFVDCQYLRSVPMRLKNGQNCTKVRHFSTATAAFQALSLSIAIALFYFQSGAESTIQFVIAALGLGGVNAVLMLPTNPTVAICKLMIYVVTPPIFLTIQAIVQQDLGVFFATDVYGSMSLLFVSYMLLAFTRSGLKSSRQTRALNNSRLSYSETNAKLERQQNELLKLSMVARQTNDCVILADTHRRIEWVNEAFSELSGFSAEQAIGQSILELVETAGQDLNSYAELIEAIKHGNTYREEIKNVLSSGRVLWVDVNLTPIFNAMDEIEFFVMIARDITAVKEHSLRMLQARNAAEDAVRAKSDFLANMSHEIRTPMTGIIGMADLMSETQQTEEQNYYTQTIIGSSRSLLTIINDILDLSKMDAGKLEINASDFSIHTCFDQTVRLMSTSARGKGLKLGLAIAEDTPSFLVADELRIRQVANNIIGNAVKFTHTGQVDVDVWCEKLGDEQFLHVAVNDTGVGIPADKLATIFDQFTQAETSTTRRFGGTGLGLAISRVLVNMMGGEIEVTSTFADGSRFHFWLPVTPGQEQNIVPDTSLLSPQDYQDQLAGTKVLVAEDNSTNRMLIRKLLEKLPVSVQFAKDGNEAVEYALQDPPDLIFMDMSMPKMSGIEATRAIRANAVVQPKIVALTANAFEAEKNACLEAGMDDFLTKPIRRNALGECLARHVTPRSVLAPKTNSEIYSDQT